VLNDPTNSDCSIVNSQNPGTGGFANKGDTVKLTVTFRPQNSCIYIKYIPKVFATAIFPVQTKS
jgi:hypothetical protein